MLLQQLCGRCRVIRLKCSFSTLVLQLWYLKHEMKKLKGTSTSKVGIFTDKLSALGDWGTIWWGGASKSDLHPYASMFESGHLLFQRSGLLKRNGEIGGSWWIFDAGHINGQAKLWHWDMVEDRNKIQGKRMVWFQWVWKGWRLFCFVVLPYFRVQYNMHNIA